jgi:acetyl esterase/lipase
VDIFPAGSDGTPPLVILVHGGFWRAAFDRRHVRPLCNSLASHGYTVAAIEYRRVGQAGGGWPGTFDDVALAFDTVPSLVAEAGVPVGQVILAGHSAGGHLVLWGAVRHRLAADAPWRLAEPPDIAGVCALAAVSDLADAYRQGLGDSAARDLMGGGPDTFPERYAVADPAGLATPDVPVTLVHGVLDQRVPVEQSRRYVERGVRYVEIPGAEHFAVIDPLSAAWPWVRDAFAGLADVGSSHMLLP